MSVEVYGVKLERAWPGKIIQPEDHNQLVSVWQVFAAHLRQFSLARGQLSDVEALASELERKAKSMRTVKPGDAVLADDFNAHRSAVETVVKSAELLCFYKPEISSLCSDLQAQLADLQTVRSGDVITSASRNKLLDLVQSCFKVFRAAAPWAVAAKVYLLPTGCGPNPWEVLREYLQDGSIIFLPFNVEGVSGGQLKPFLDSYRLVIVNTVDTEPYYGTRSDTFYQILYRTPVVHGADMFTSVYVTYPCFKEILGDRFPKLFDYEPYSDLKVPEHVSWTDTYSGFSFVKHGRGVVVEMPSDGIWKNPSTLAKTVFALSACFLDGVEAVDVVYASFYSSTVPRWHECYPMDECWRQVCDKAGWKLYDLR